MVTGATDLEIDFRKLVCEDNDSGYKSMCVNEKIVDEKRSLRRRELAHELNREGSGLTGLAGARGLLLCCSHGLGSSWSSIGLVEPRCWARQRGYGGWHGRGRGRKKKEKEKEQMREKEEREGREGKWRGKRERKKKREMGFEF